MKSHVRENCALNTYLYPACLLDRSIEHSTRRSMVNIKALSTDTIRASFCMEPILLSPIIIFAVTSSSYNASQSSYASAS
mmetsp:Transcript_32490/g.68322  ORF Transcript_32490/g.68322 Transcript_32490/m.68322 type:complete len:80 (-) Transcript_32490:182-421(-)